MKIATKPTFIQRAVVFWSDWWFPIVLTTAMTFVVGMFIYGTMHPSPYLRAPVESCKSVYTGQQKTEGYYTYVCAAYNAQGVCTVNVPVYNEYTYREVNNQCNWNEWR